MILGTATMISRREKRSVTGRVKACLFVGISGSLFGAQWTYVLMSTTGHSLLGPFGMRVAHVILVHNNNFQNDKNM